jgi:hypothetical protein
MESGRERQAMVNVRTERAYCRVDPEAAGCPTNSPRPLAVKDTAASALGVWATGASIAQQPCPSLGIIFFAVEPLAVMGVCF